MQLAGNIGDLGLGEILQILSFSQKSGTLALKSRKRSGAMIFKDGKISKAYTSAIKEGVGEVLLKGGAITAEVLEAAKASQSAKGYIANLGQVFMSEFSVNPEHVEEATKKLIEKTVYSFFFWTDGSFVFELTEPEENPETIKADQLQFTLEDGLNPQFLAMEGSRLFDEFVMKGGKPGDPSEYEETEPVPTPTQEPTPKTEEGVNKEASAPVPSKVFAEGTDELPFLSGDFLKELESEGLIDLEEGGEADERIEESKGLTLLKEMLEELSRPLTMSEIVLLILRFTSEIMARAVVFSIRKDNIVGGGQYGIELNEGNADMRIRKMKIPINEPSILTEAIEARRTLVKPIEPGKWNDYIIERLGGTHPTEAFLSPVMVRGNAIIIIYADNIPGNEKIDDISSLEIFLAQTGMALERLMLQEEINK